MQDTEGIVKQACGWDELYIALAGDLGVNIPAALLEFELATASYGLLCTRLLAAETLGHKHGIPSPATSCTIPVSLCACLRELLDQPVHPAPLCCLWVSFQFRCLGDDLTIDDNQVCRCYVGSPRVALFTDSS
jgi:hypothetical protein